MRKRFLFLLTGDCKLLWKQNLENLCAWAGRYARTVCSLRRVALAHIPASLPKKISDSTTLATDSSRTLCCASHGKTTAPSDHLRLQPDTHHPGCTLVLFGNGFLGCCYSCRNQTICFPCREGGISVASRILSQFEDLLGSVQCG